MRLIVLVHDALMVTKDVLEKPLIVAGGGSPEAYVANKLRRMDKYICQDENNLQQKNLLKHWRSFHLTLAENAGMDPIDTMTELRSKQSKGSTWTG